MAPHIVIIGGGLAGLSAGCYALRSGFRTTIVEHNLALGGVCTAWHRGPFTVDGCIHWLTGGPFTAIYEELGILPAVALRPLEVWTTYRDARRGTTVPFTRDLDQLVADLIRMAPEDAEELRRIRAGARAVVQMHPPLDAPELGTLRDSMRAIWDMRGALSPIVHFRKPLGDWVEAHLTSPALRRLFTAVLPEGTPALFLLMVLGYLERGYLSRPIGGTAAFRDALVRSYESLGGVATVHATVDEVLVEGGRARGVRLSDGTMLHSDVVVSTSSAPETVLRLLGGRYEADATRERMEHWKLFEPIVLASFGVAAPYAEAPALQVIDGIEPFEVGGRVNDRLYVRTCNDDPSFAPEGHTVVQATLSTTYEYWATRGTRYGAAKDEIADVTLRNLESHFPDIRARVRMTDIATPLTYWTMARSWRGAYEGWMPSSDAIFGHVKKTLGGLSDFYMAGQWVEPGGGVPSAVMSGRQVAQLICQREGRPFVAR
jgi:phytoene dehydrogenase-like protein